MDLLIQHKKGFHNLIGTSTHVILLPERSILGSLFWEERKEILSDKFDSTSFNSYCDIANRKVVLLGFSGGKNNKANFTINI